MVINKNLSVNRNFNNLFLIGYNKSVLVPILSHNFFSHSVHCICCVHVLYVLYVQFINNSCAEEYSVRFVNDMYHKRNKKRFNIMKIALNIMRRIDCNIKSERKVVKNKTKNIEMRGEL